MSEQTLNIPQLLIVAFIGFLAIRWYLSRSASSASGHDSTQAPGSGRQGAASRVNPAHVEQISQMFPQLSRRDILWNLQRNGGSVQAVTERVLGGRGLESPPPSFQPPLPATPSSSNTQTARGQQQQQQRPDLITRYNLAERIKSLPQDVSDSAAESKKPAWSQSKSERAKELQRRREEMILVARRNMEEKDRKMKEEPAGS